MPVNKLKNQVHASTFPIASWLLLSATMGTSTVVLAQSNDDGVVREAQPSQSVRDVLREEHALFSNRLTIEPGISYSYSDRSELALNGFLALDAIFLGNISVDDVESHTTTFDLSTRYGVTDRLELELMIPYVYRSTHYETIGAGGATGSSVEETVSEGGLGDISAGLYYRLLPETESRPDIVWNFSVRAPTGKHPYDIGRITVDLDGTENLTVPSELPTGNGVWGVSTGFSLLKTIDPAIIFANIGYTHNIEESFDDISSDDDKVPGKVNLGDSVRFGFGTAFALNERFSLSMSLSYQHAFETEITQDGGPSENIIGSSANSASVNFGATYGLTDSTSIVTSVGVGLTDDAPDFTLDFRIPFQI
ncbi:MAG: transporter [Pseudomonadota bacterium]